MTSAGTVMTAVVAAAALFVGVGIGQYRARVAIATVCEPQPGAILVSSYQNPKEPAIACSYLDTPVYARPLRRAPARRAT